MEYQCDDNFIFLGYSSQIAETVHFTLRTYRNSSEGWISDGEIMLSQFIDKPIKSVSFVERRGNAGIVVIFLSSDDDNHLLRYDMKLRQITHIRAFPAGSTFYPRQACCSGLSIDAVIDQEHSVTVVLVSEDSDTMASLAVTAADCPTIAELQAVLNGRLIAAVRTLCRFWMANVDALGIATSGTPGGGTHSQALASFLYVHHRAMLAIIGERCNSENATTSEGNRFVEQLSNLTNDYINEAINALSRMAATLGLTVSFMALLRTDEIDAGLLL